VAWGEAKELKKIVSYALKEGAGGVFCFK
jgi:hypothetical protein